MKMDLYNKTRPVQFSKMYNTSKAIPALIKMTNNDTMAHSFIFHGIPGVGKTTAAKIIPFAINCTSKEEKPCMTCENCKMILQNPEIAYEEINVSDFRGIDDIRALSRKMQEVGMMRLRKVYILNEAERMTKDAQFAFKDPLEKLNDYTYVVITTNNIKGLIPELVQRCQVYPFKGVNAVEAIQLITNISKEQNIDITKDNIARLVELVENRAPRQLIQVLQQYSEVGDDALKRIDEIDDNSPIGRLISAIIYRKKDYAQFSAIRNDLFEYLASESPYTLQTIILGATKNLVLNAEKYDRMNKDTQTEFVKRYPIINEILLPELVYHAPIADLVYRFQQLLKQIRIS